MSAFKNIAFRGKVSNKSGGENLHLGLQHASTGSPSSIAKNVKSQLETQLNYYPVADGEISSIKVFVPKTHETKSEEGVKLALDQVFPDKESYINQIVIDGTSFLYVKVIVNKELAPSSILKLGSIPVSTGTVGNRMKHMEKQIRSKKIESLNLSDYEMIELYVGFKDEITTAAVNGVLVTVLPEIIAGLSAELMSSRVSVTHDDPERLKVVISL